MKIFYNDCDGGYTTLTILIVWLCQLYLNKAVFVFVFSKESAREE